MKANPTGHYNWSWTSPIPLQCTSHSVQLRYRDHQHTSAWTTPTTLPGAYSFKFANELYSMKSLTRLNTQIHSVLTNELVMVIHSDLMFTFMFTIYIWHLYLILIFVVGSHCCYIICMYLPIQQSLLITFFRNFSLTILNMLVKTIRKRHKHLFCVFVYK